MTRVLCCLFSSPLGPGTAHPAVPGVWPWAHPFGPGRGLQVSPQIFGGVVDAVWGSATGANCWSHWIQLFLDDIERTSDRDPEDMPVARVVTAVLLGPVGDTGAVCVPRE